MKFILNKDNLIIENAIVPHSGSVKYYEADVEMDSSWNGLTVACILKKKTEEKGTAISVINNKIFIDKELGGDYVVGFIGYLLDYVLTEDTE